MKTTATTKSSSFLTATKTVTLLIFLVLGISTTMTTMTGASAAACPSNYEKGPRGTCVGEPIDFVCPAGYHENPDNRNECLIDEPPAPGEEVDERVGKVGVCSAGTYVAPEINEESGEEDTGKCIAPRGERLD